MHRTAKFHGLARLAGSVGWPLLVGGAASSLFYAALYRGPLDWPILHRYFAGHPISVSETVLFFVGLSALVLKLIEVVRQSYWINRPPVLPDNVEGDFSADAVAALGHWMNDHRRELASNCRSWLGRRIVDVLEHIVRSGTADRLEEQLQRQAEQAEQNQHDSYALVRICVWAIPMLGFLGTVVGIAQALGNLDPKQLASDPAQAMQGLLAGLYVAFDTTALALSLSLLLMFVQFPIDRMEVQLLDQVSRRAGDLLIGRFRSLASSADPHVASVERMCYAVIRAAEKLVERQAHLWSETIQGTIGPLRDEWLQNWQRASQTLRDALAAATDSALERYAARLEQIEQRAADEAARRWAGWQEGLRRAVELLENHLQAAAQQTTLLQQTLEVTGDVIRLEKALNDNLEQLAEAKHFEETVTSLAAAIQLLSAKLTSGTELRRVELRPATLQQERAA